LVGPRGVDHTRQSDPTCVEPGSPADAPRRVDEDTGEAIAAPERDWPERRERPAAHEARAGGSTGYVSGTVVQPLLRLALVRYLCRVVSCHTAPCCAVLCRGALRRILRRVISPRQLLTHRRAPIGVRPLYPPVPTSASTRPRLLGFSCTREVFLAGVSSKLHADLVLATPNEASDSILSINAPTHRRTDAPTHRRTDAQLTPSQMVIFTSSMGFMEGKTPFEIKQKFSDVSAA
jgi:hypothetical protein